MDFLAGLIAGLLPSKYRAFWIALVSVVLALLLVFLVLALGD